MLGGSVVDGVVLLHELHEAVVAVAEVDRDGHALDLIPQRVADGVDLRVLDLVEKGSNLLRSHKGLACEGLPVLPATAGAVFVHGGNHAPDVGLEALRPAAVRVVVEHGGVDRSVGTHLLGVGSEEGSPTSSAVHGGLVHGG